MNQINNFTKGLLRENPILVLLLGTCPTLAVTSSAVNGLGMGLATTFVLFMSNVFISMVKGFVPDKVRIPAFIVVIASFVTVVDLLMQAYTPSLSNQLGIFIPLIVVNCIVLGRAEAFAAKNNVFSSFIDGMGMGLGFTLALVVMGSIREMLGAGAIFGYKFIPETADGVLIFILAPGAFITLGFMIAILKKINKTS
jgi:electron transport complex protein RnfE